MKISKRLLAMILVILGTFSFSGCLKYTSNILEVTTPNQSSEIYTETPVASTSYYIATTNADVTTAVPTTTVQEATTALSDVTSTTVQSEQVTQTPVTTAPVSEVQTTAAATKTPAQWTKAEILQNLSNAITKTKAYTGAVTVKHTENFSFNVDNVTGGSTVQSFANKIIASVAEPSDETLNFNGGTATNSEGETVPLLLPKKGSFYLDEAGCTSITASSSGNNTVIKCTLIKESVDMNSTPKYNSSACGYLDISTLDLSVITITSFNIDYEGTTLTITINPNGYVSKAEYHVPLALKASGKMSFISADVEASGYEDEVWTINW